MSAKLFGELRELIQRHVDGGQNADDVIGEIRDTLAELEQTHSAKRLPDPPHLDEMISPPCDLPRMGPAFVSKVNWGAKRQPDPLPE